MELIIKLFIRLFFIGLFFYFVIYHLKTDNLIRASFSFTGLVLWITLLILLIKEKE